MTSMGATTRRGLAVVGMAASAGLVLTACASAAASDRIEVSGSSTVAPITEHVSTTSEYAVSVTAEGSEDGFARFCAGESAINNASEAIPQQYMDACASAGIEFIELPVAWDALTVVVHADNDYARDMTMDEFAQIWSPDSTVETWQDVRAEWPDEELNLYGRPAGSGTFATFTHEINGAAGEIRDDVTASDDIAALTSWIAEDPNGMGFMGIGNYLGSAETRDDLTTVSIDRVSPSLEHAQDGTYPLARPLFIYASMTALESEDVAGFVEHYLENAQASAALTFYYALDDSVSALVQQRFTDRVTGSMFDGDPFGDVNLAEALARR